MDDGPQYKSGGVEAPSGGQAAVATILVLFLSLFGVSYLRERINAKVEVAERPCAPTVEKASQSDLPGYPQP